MLFFLGFTLITDLNDLILKIKFLCLALCYVWLKYVTVLCEKLKSIFISIYFARNMGNRCRDLLKHG